MLEAAVDGAKLGRLIDIILSIEDGRRLQAPFQSGFPARPTAS
jgi:hypothetical protein